MASSISYLNKPKRKHHIPIDGHLLSTKLEGKNLNIQETNKYMNQRELKIKIKERMISKQKAEVLGYMKEYIVHLSLQIYRRHFVFKVSNKIKDIFMNAAMKAFKKYQSLKNKRQLIMMLRKKDGVPNFIKRIFLSRIKASKIIKERKNKEILLKRRSKGFIGKLKQFPVIKK